jgi:ribose transport system ATP-binding protein
MSDRVSALRDGRNAGTAETAVMDETKLVSLMLGREVERVAMAKHDKALTSPRLSVRGLASGKAAAVSFELARGEVVGLAGLLGSGTSDVLRALFGAQPTRAGEVLLDGESFVPRGPADAIARRVAYLPPDRALDASFNSLSVRANLSAVNVGRYFQGLRLRHDREHADAQDAIDRFMIRTASDQAPLATLSGGNQQKVVVSRWLRDEPSLFLLDEPTQGVAAHARREIHGFLRDAAREGTSLLVVSSDFEELAQLCDRVLILVHGRIAGEVRPPHLDSHRLTELAHFAQVPA